ncbi:MAG TPA: recombinase family protein, partial [Bacillota bacterium]|nr:recombinase family protein [Bacillota bacterium]
EKKSINAVVVKDLSRLGRHKTQTAMFIDYLREHDVRVLSVTENIDTSNEDDELMVGFKGIFNDMYCRDISKKIRFGYRQKQKDGIVLIPPMGYFKDKNTGEVVIVEEQAEIVRRIFDLYLSGYGIKAIAKILNVEGIKSQGYYQKKLLGKNIGSNKPEIAHRFLWENTGVKRVLQNEFYKGTLVCHKSYTNKINHVRKDLPQEERFVHEDYVPAIISKEIWERAQFLLKDKVVRNVRAGNGKPYHRYTGLIECGECGSSFVCKVRHWRDKPDRIEYVCNGNHRYGNENCTPHRVDESDLDRLIYEELIQIKDAAQRNYTNIESDVKKWLSQRNTSERKIKDMTAKLEQRQSDQQQILLERIRDREHADIYTQMLAKCEADIDSLLKQIDAIRDYDTTIKKRKAEMKTGIDLINDIVSEGAISDTHLRMLIDKIVIHEKDKRLNIAIFLKAEFRRHMDFYDENGEVTDKAFECNDNATLQNDIWQLMSTENFENMI